MEDVSSLAKELKLISLWHQARIVFLAQFILALTVSSAGYMLLILLKMVEMMPILPDCLTTKSLIRGEGQLSIEPFQLDDDTKDAIRTAIKVGKVSCIA